MKKILKVLMSFVIVATVTLSALVLNVSAASVSISGGGEYEVGKSFNVTVRFNADANLYAVEADISYNSSVLRLDGVSGADYNASNGTIKIVDDGFSATKPSKSSSYTLKFTAIAAGNSPISASMLGGGDAASKAASSAAIKVVTPKPSSNANLASIKLSSGSLSPAFNANTTSYNVTVKYSVDSITITGAVADGSSKYVGGGTFALQVGDNQRTLTVTAADGTKKSYTINIKRMTEQETADAEQAARDANPFLVTIDGSDYNIANDLSGITVPAGFSQSTSARKGSEVPVIKDENEKYVLYWLTDASGENGAFYVCDDEGNFTRIKYVSSNGKMYIIEPLESDLVLPSGYVKTTYSVDGGEVDAISYENESLKDFYILNCYVDGKTAMYRFDTLESTMQRAAEFELALTSTDAPVEKSNGIIEWFKNINKTGKIVFFIIVLCAIALIVLAILLIVKVASSKDDDFDDNQIILSTDNDFNFNPAENSNENATDGDSANDKTENPPENDTIDDVNGSDTGSEN